MRLTQGESRELRAGRYITRRMRLRSTGEEFSCEVKRSWDVLYYSVDDGPWMRTASSALEAIRLDADRPALESWKHA